MFSPKKKTYPKLCTFARDCFFKVNMQLFSSGYRHRYITLGENSEQVYNSGNRTKS